MDKLITSASALSLYLVFFLFLIPSVEPRLIDLTWLANFKYLIVGMSLLFNFICLLLFKPNLHLTLSHRLVYAFLMVLLITLPFSSSFIDSFMRVISVLMVVLFLGTNNNLNILFYESLLKLGYMVALFTVGISIPMYLIIGEIFNVSGNFQGTYYNSNFLGMVCVLICIPSVLHFIHFRHLRFNKIKLIVNLSMLLGLFSLILLSRSRAAFVSLFILLLVFYFLRAKSAIKFSLKLVVILLIFILSVVLFSNEKQKDDFMSQYVFKYESSGSLSSVTTTRMEIWSIRFQAINLKPIFGWGYGVNPAKTSPLIKDPGNGNTEKGNSILALIEEFGVIFGTGIIIIYVLLITSALISFAKFTNAEIRDKYSLSLAILAAGFIHSNFESWLFYFGNVVTIFYWGILLNISNLKKSN